MTRHERIAGAHQGVLPTLTAAAAAGSLPFLAAVAATGGMAILATPALGQQHITYTTDADFDLGVLDHVNHTAVHDQLLG